VRDDAALHGPPAPSAVDHDFIRRAVVDAPLLQPAAVWTEGLESTVGSGPYRWVHCAVPGCSAEIRNVKPARLAHIRMHLRAAARAASAGGDAPEPRRAPRVTMKDVARRAGLDTSSVHKILSEIPGPVFSEKTIQRVRRIAEKIGFQFHPTSKKVQADAARALITAAEDLSVEVSKVHGAAAERFLAQLLKLDAALIEARRVWPASKETRDAGKAVGS
jgi:hypothetical protein